MNKTKALNALDILAQDVSELITEKKETILQAMEKTEKILDGEQFTFTVSLGGVIKQDPDIGRLVVETKIGWGVKEKHTTTRFVEDGPTLFDGHEGKVGP